MQKSKPSFLARDPWILGIVLVAGLVHGLVYVFFIPPWQHNDEPNHFEYVAWMAAYGHKPEMGDYDPQMHRLIVESMVAHDFYRPPLTPPDLSPGQEVRIGLYNQFQEPPLYYQLAALPVRLLPEAAVTVQLYAARLVSLLLFLVTLIAAWGMMRELTASGSLLRWMVPLSLALLPGFVNSMTSVNNDVLAIAGFTLFLWLAARLVRRFSLFSLVGTLAAAGLCLFTKSTAYIAAVLAPLAVVFAVLKRGWGRRIAWGLVGLGAVAGLLWAITWGDAALWYRSTGSAGLTRMASEQAVHGKHVLLLDTRAPVTPGWSPPLFQPLPWQTISEHQGEAVTVGVWMWASRPVQAQLPALCFEKQAFGQSSAIGTEPTFYAYYARIPEGEYHGWIELDPGLKQADRDVEIYYDGLVLATGNRPLRNSPKFDSASGDRGTWGGEEFANLIRNPSAELAGPRVRALLDDLGARVLPDNQRPSLILASVLDPQVGPLFYWSTAIMLTRTFYGLFGWGNVPLLTMYPYRTLGYITLVVLIAAAIALFRRRRSLPWDQAFLTGLALLLVWAAAILRGPLYLGFSHLFNPSARYAYPVIAPTLLVLCLGWREILNWAGRRLRPGARLGIYAALLVALDLFALISIYAYYGKG